MSINFNGRTTISRQGERNPRVASADLILVRDYRDATAERTGRLGWRSVDGRPFSEMLASALKWRDELAARAAQSARGPVSASPTVLELGDGVHVVNLDTAAARRLETMALGKEMGFRWLRDGEALFGLRAADGTPLAVFRMDENHLEEAYGRDGAPPSGAESPLVAEAASHLGARLLLGTAIDRPAPDGCHRFVANNGRRGRAHVLAGRIHSDAGPAIESRRVAGSSKPDREWLVDGRRHRADGAAVEWANGDREYHLNGARLSEKAFNAAAADAAEAEAAPAPR